MIVMANMLQEARQRLKCETPPFFKKIRAYAVSLAVSAASVLVADSTMGLGLAPIVITVCKYAIAAGAAAGGLAQLTAVNPPKNS